MTKPPKTEPQTFQVLLRCYHFVYVGRDGNGDAPRVSAWCPACQKHQALMSAIPLAQSYF